jgi:hypothetical protein
MIFTFLLESTVSPRDYFAVRMAVDNLTPQFQKKVELFHATISQIDYY